MKQLHFNRQCLYGWLGGWLLSLAGSIAIADTPPFPTTAAEIEQALKAPKYRSFVDKWRGPAGIVNDPMQYSPVVDTNSYTILQDLPKAAALIHFDVNSARIRGDAYSLLNQYAQALKGGLADAVLVIAGHTDNTGAETYNWNLSRRRAQAVEDYLTAQGIPETRFIVKAYGESQPIASNATRVGRARNRRVEFIRVGSLD